MQSSASPAFLTVPQLEKIPFLHHGYGTSLWREQDFKRRPEWRDFRLIFLHQIHSDVVHSVDDSFDNNIEGDAMITDRPHLFLVIKTADCLPIFMVDERQRVIAAVHCGWRGTRKRVIPRAVRALERRYGCSTPSLLVAMGPCIGRDCYEVGEDVVRLYREAGVPLNFFRIHPERPSQYLFDLRAANLSQLLDLGVKKANIFSVDVCSHCRLDFPSYRRDGKSAGRMLSFIGMS